MNGSRVGMRPFLALSTASVIPAAFHDILNLILNDDASTDSDGDVEELKLCL